MDIKIIRSKRKTLSLSIDDNLSAVVRAPYFVSNDTIMKFVQNNEKWLEQAYIRKKSQLEKYNLSDDEVQKLVSSAKEIIPSRVEHYSSLMKLTPTSVKITKAKKRFGSCNGSNGLCFSCYLMLYPMEAVDYVVVHELAHIVYHNHSKAFYRLIAQYMPDYKGREKLLKS
ncbi:MAG: M48 family metallopeptidase [Clostridium sp.]|nr:M48 family metallopeptidase [Clostridium sp.]